MIKILELKLKYKLLPFYGMTFSLEQDLYKSLHYFTKCFKSIFPISCIFFLSLRIIVLSLSIVAYYHLN